MASHKIDIYSPRFVGRRFEDHTVPLELLEDIASLEDITIEVAKWLYLKANEGRQRVPRGFKDGISMQLEAIEPGSTRLKIALIVLSANLFPPENAEYFKQASIQLVKAIQAAEDHKDVTEHIPDRYLSYFNRIGNKLQNGEWIEFSPDNVEKKARLTKESRKRLILASESTKEYTDDIQIRGYISEMDKTKSSFMLQRLDGQRIVGSYHVENLKDLQDAFNQYESKQLVRITGVGNYNRSDNLQSIESIASVELLDDADVRSRIEVLTHLKDGWLNGQGKAITKPKLSEFTRLFESNYSPDLPLPYLFPTIDGNIQAEWSNEQFEISLHVDLENLASQMHILDLDSKQGLELDFDLSMVEGWENLNTELKKRTV